MNMITEMESAGHKHVDILCNAVLRVAVSLSQLLLHLLERFDVEQAEPALEHRGRSCDDGELCRFVR